jgi:hypothetical protein
MLSQLIKQFPNHTVKAQKTHYRSKYPCGVVLTHPKMNMVVAAIRGWYQEDHWIRSKKTIRTKIEGYNIDPLRQLVLKLTENKDKVASHAGNDTLSIYFGSADQLILFVEWAEKCKIHDNDLSWIRSITAVQDGQQVGACAASKRYADFEYKVLLKYNNRLVYEIRPKLKKIFANVADNVHLPPRTRDMFDPDRYWPRNNCFYVKDQSTMSYLCLTCSDILGKIYTIHSNQVVDPATLINQAVSE